MERRLFNKRCWLQRSSLTHRLSAAQIETLSNVLHEQRFVQGQIIFDLSDVGDALYIVAEGVVRIYLPIERGDDIIERNLQLVAAGQFFGELALLTSQGQRTASARAIGDVTTLSLHRSQFDMLFERHPAIVAQLLFEQMASRVRNDNLYISAMSSRSAMERVLRYLLLFASPSKGAASGLFTVEVPAPHWQLANVLGLSREAVCRSLSRLKQGGLIEEHKHSASSRLITFDEKQLRSHLTSQGWRT